MGINMTIYSTSMKFDEIIEFCNKWNNHTDWSYCDMYVDYDEELKNNFKEQIGWRAKHTISVYNWLVENGQKSGMFILKTELINELSVFINNLLKDLSKKLGNKHNIKDYLIDDRYWDHNKPNFQYAYEHYNLLFAKKDIDKLMKLLDELKDINLVCCIN